MAFPQLPQLIGFSLSWEFIAVIALLLLAPAINSKLRKYIAKVFVIYHPYVKVYARETGKGARRTSPKLFALLSITMVALAFVSQLVPAETLILKEDIGVKQPIVVDVDYSKPPLLVAVLDISYSMNTPREKIELGKKIMEDVLDAVCSVRSDVEILAIVFGSDVYNVTYVDCSGAEKLFEAAEPIFTTYTSGVKALVIARSAALAASMSDRAVAVLVVSDFEFHDDLDEISQEVQRFSDAGIHVVCVFVGTKATAMENILATFEYRGHDVFDARSTQPSEIVKTVSNAILEQLRPVGLAKRSYTAYVTTEVEVEVKKPMYLAATTMLLLGFALVFSIVYGSYRRR